MNVIQLGQQLANLRVCGPIIHASSSFSDKQWTFSLLITIVRSLRNMVCWSCILVDSDDYVNQTTILFSLSVSTRFDFNAFFFFIFIFID